jgi:hypothetical protein
VTTTGDDAFLFVRGHQSIYVKRLALGMTLLVCGPGEDEHSHHFRSEASLDEFWHWYRRHLLASDWLQCASAERRSTPREDREQPERRRRSRD